MAQQAALNSQGTVTRSSGLLGHMRLIILLLSILSWIILLKIIDVISKTESNCALKFVFLRPVFYVFIVSFL